MITGEKRPRKPAKAIVFFNNAWYSLKDLTDTIDAANAEAQGYLDQLKPLKVRNDELVQRLRQLQWQFDIVRSVLDGPSYDRR